MEKSLSIHINNLALLLLQKLGLQNNLVILCLGDNGVTFDSLGPQTGSLLKAQNCPFFVYGDTLHCVTKSNLHYYLNLLAIKHKTSKILIVDSAMGEDFDLGNIKVYNCGTVPRSGIDNKFEMIGDASILGIVSENNTSFYDNFKIVNKCLISSMSKQISSAILEFSKYNQIFQNLALHSS